MKVQIMSREALTELARKPFSEGTAVISITDSEADEVFLENQPEHLLRLQFDDVSDEIFEELLGRKPSVGEMHRLADRFHMLSNTQAEQIADFVLSLENRGTLICQCECGQSRSAAVAAAVLEYRCRKGINVFADPRYYPNKYVFRKLLSALRARGIRNTVAPGELHKQKESD